MSTPNNPYAYPSLPVFSSDGGDFFHEGMTLRDYFAGQALTGIYANSLFDDDHIVNIAGHAYEVADAMLKKRSRGEAE